MGQIVKASCLKNFSCLKDILNGVIENFCLKDENEILFSKEDMFLAEFKNKY